MEKVPMTPEFVPRSYFHGASSKDPGSGSTELVPRSTAVTAVRGLAKKCHGPDERGHDRVDMGRIHAGEHPDKRRGGSLGPPWPIGRKVSDAKAALECIAEGGKAGSQPRTGAVQAREADELAPDGDRGMEAGYSVESCLEELVSAGPVLWGGSHGA